MTINIEQPLTIELVSVPDRDDLVAEVWLGRALLAELRQEGGQVRVQLYPDSSGQPWDLPVADLCSALAKASAKLSGNDQRCT